MEKKSFVSRILDAVIPRRRALALGSRLESVKSELLADGKIDYAETTRLLEIIRPFVRLGDTNAVKLQKLLADVRDDGRIDSLESELVIGLLDLISERYAKLKGEVAG